MNYVELKEEYYTKRNGKAEVGSLTNKEKRMEAIRRELELIKAERQAEKCFN